YPRAPEAPQRGQGPARPRQRAGGEAGVLLRPLGLGGAATGGELGRGRDGARARQARRSPHPGLIARASAHGRPRRPRHRRGRRDRRGDGPTLRGGGGGGGPRRQRSPPRPRRPRRGPSPPAPPPPASPPPPPSPPGPR